MGTRSILFLIKHRKKIHNHGQKVIDKSRYLCLSIIPLFLFLRKRQVINSSPVYNKNCSLSKQNLDYYIPNRIIEKNVQLIFDNQNEYFSIQIHRSIIKKKNPIFLSEITKKKKKKKKKK